MFDSTIWEKIGNPMVFIPYISDVSVESRSLLCPTKKISHKPREPHKQIGFYILFHHSAPCHSEVHFWGVWIMFLLGLFHLSLPFQRAASYGLNRCSMNLHPGGICFQIWSVEEPGRPVLGVAFLFMPPRMRMPKVLHPEQSHSLCKRIIALASQYFS